MAIDPKKAALIILAKKKPSGDPSGDNYDSMDGKGDPSPGKVSAMEDFIAAVNDGDAKAACKALEAYQGMGTDAG